ncbi:hypothetical protein Tco_1068105 [Tanacetum coccineum]|uniref:Uncharacterized protein n=1 Tax=Tanacetum coccineum TaxID=301880 RepID=A0ABQ5HES5_9ASTR
MEEIAINDEIVKRRQLGSMRVSSLSRLSLQPVMVMKSATVGRLCVDFKDNNKAYAVPMARFTLCRIDWRANPPLVGFLFNASVNAYRREAEVHLGQMRETHSKLPMLTAPEEQKEKPSVLMAESKVRLE